jgi:hypothetical protein
LALAVVVVLFSTPAHAADVTGKWKAEFDTQVGDFATEEFVATRVKN